MSHERAEVFEEAAGICDIYSLCSQVASDCAAALRVKAHQERCAAVDVWNAGRTGRVWALLGGCLIGLMLSFFIALEAHADDCLILADFGQKVAVARDQGMTRAQMEAVIVAKHLPSDVEQRALDVITYVYVVHPAAKAAGMAIYVRCLTQPKE